MHSRNIIEMKPREGDDETSSKWSIHDGILTLYNVKKGLAGSGDNAVYQCKAENKHGYVWTNFYLNLLGMMMAVTYSLCVRFTHWYFGIATA